MDCKAACGRRLVGEYCAYAESVHRESWLVGGRSGVGVLDASGREAYDENCKNGKERFMLCHNGQVCSAPLPTALPRGG